jgi:hypothetical protein
MGDYYDRARGHFLFRHKDKRYVHHARLVGFGGELVADADDLNFLDSQLEGPWAGWMKLETKDNTVYPRLWAQTAPAFFGPKGGRGILQPALNWIEGNKHLKRVKANTPFNLLYPGGYPAILLPDAGLDEQHDNAAPIWAGIICPSEAGSIDYSSPVWPITSGNDIDARSPAPVASAWYVYERPKNNLIFGTHKRPKHDYRSLAWHTGLAGPDRLESVAGLGMCVEKHVAKTVLFAAGRSVGGMLHPGRFSDQHRISLTPDGIPINAQHTQTQMIWIRPDGSGDAPQEDGGEWNPRTVIGPLLVKTFWRFDSEDNHRWALGAGEGLWKWQTASFIGLIPPPKKPKKPKKPKDIINVIPPKLLPLGGEDVFDPSQPPDDLNPTGSPLYNLGNREIQQGLPSFGAPREVSFSALVGRAPLLRDGELDLRNGQGSLTDDQLQHWASSPAVIRRDYGAALIGGSFDYTHQPGDGRYDVGGSADGAEYLMPPELSLEMAGNSLTGLEYSTPHQVLWETTLALGTPHPDSGAFKDGFKFELDKSSGTKLKLSHVSVIPATSASKILFGAGSIEADGNITCDHASPTVLNFPSVTITSSSATLTIEWGSVLVNYAGAVSLTLPNTADFALDATELMIADISGAASSNAITITRAGSDVIGGGTSHTISSDYGSLTLRALSGRWVIVSEFTS